MKYFMIISFISSLISQIPDQYSLLSNSLRRFDGISIKDALPSNVIVDIHKYGDSLYFFGTGSGLSFGELNNDGTITIHHDIFTALVFKSTQSSIFYKATLLCL